MVNILKGFVNFDQATKMHMNVCGYMGLAGTNLDPKIARRYYFEL